MVTCLKGGVLVEEAAVALALELEAHGHSLAAQGSDLFVSEPAALTDWNRSEIRRLKWHLLAIAAYDYREETARGSL